MQYDIYTLKKLSQELNKNLKDKLISNIINDDKYIIFSINDTILIYYIEHNNLFFFFVKKQNKIIKNKKIQIFKEILPSLIIDINQIPNERILKFTLKSKSLLFYNKIFYLYFHIFNKWPNLILTDSNNIIKKAYSYTSNLQTSKFIILPNIEYKILKTNKKTLIKYHKLSIDTYKKIIYLKEPIVINKENYQYSVLKIPNLKNLDKYENLNSLTIKLFKQHKQNLIKKIKQKVKKRLKREIEKKERKLEKQKKELNFAKIKNTVYKQAADWIFQNMFKLKDNKNITNIKIINEIIKINPKLSLSENAEKLYKKYKKLKKSIKTLENIIKVTQEEIIKLKNNLNNEQIEIDNDSINKLKASYNQKLKFKKLTYKNYTIYIGKNEKQSGYILSKIASKNDLWLHIKNAAGSHIIVKSNDNKFSQEVIIKAAKLSAYYSKLKTSEKVEVVYTLRKYVKKKKTTLAFVTYKNSKTIIVKPEKEDFIL